MYFPFIVVARGMQSRCISEPPNLLMVTQCVQVLLCYIIALVLYNVYCAISSLNKWYL